MQSSLSNKLNLIVENLNFNKIISISEDYNKSIVNSLPNDVYMIDIISHVDQIKDQTDNENLVILEVDERQHNQDMLLKMAKLRTYHQTNLIILIKHMGTLATNLFHETLMSYGFKHLFREKLENIFYDLYEYNIIDYKIKPEWLNSDYWANPELWKK